ncbi:MAG: hypothetical protein AB7O28_09695 [Vicinamibacterales bacterium]
MTKRSTSMALARWKTLTLDRSRTARKMASSSRSNSPRNASATLSASGALIAAMMSTSSVERGSPLSELASDPPTT